MKLPEELQFIENARLPQKITDARLDGRLVVLTGATSGVGYQAAKHLAQGGANLVLVCRNAAKATSVQAELQRDTTAQVDAAIRWALNVYSQNRPLISTYSLDTDGNQTIELPDDFAGSRIIGVDLYDADIDDVRALVYYAYETDEAWFIKTMNETIDAGEVLTITYAANHTIDNLDSAAGTTIPVEHEEFVCVGAAGYALSQRISSRLENVNLNEDTIREMRQIASANIAFFLTYISAKPSASYAALPPVPTDEF